MTVFTKINISVVAVVVLISVFGVSQITTAQSQSEQAIEIEQLLYTIDAYNPLLNRERYLQDADVLGLEDDIRKYQYELSELERQRNKDLAYYGGITLASGSFLNKILAGINEKYDSKASDIYKKISRKKKRLNKVFEKIDQQINDEAVFSENQRQIYLDRLKLELSQKENIQAQQLREQTRRILELEAAQKADVQKQQQIKDNETQQQLREQARRIQELEAAQREGTQTQQQTNGNQTQEQIREQSRRIAELESAQEDFTEQIKEVKRLKTRLDGLVEKLKSFFSFFSL